MAFVLMRQLREKIFWIHAAAATDAQNFQRNPQNLCGQKIYQKRYWPKNPEPLTISLWSSPLDFYLLKR